MIKHFILILFVFFGTTLEGQRSLLKKEIDKIIAYDSDISYELTPGFVIGVFDGDSVYFESFGTKKGSETKDFFPNDIFEIGSITKTLTASLVYSMASKKLLSLNDKVNKFLPIDYQNPRLKNLTIEDLINHRTSFSRRPSMFGEKEEEFQNPYKYYGKEDLLKYYSNFVPEKKSKFNYSHTSYALLEIVIETACRCSFHDAANEFLFSKLDMQNSFVSFKEKREGVLVTGFDRSQEKVEPWTFNSFSGSEGMRSTAEDLIKYLKAFSQLSSSELDFILPNTIKTYEPSFTDKLYYGQGWHMMKINKKFRALISSGSTSGHSAFIATVPETKTGVVILANSSYGTHDLGLLVLRMINYNWKRKPQ